MLRIITDSTSSISQEEAKKLNIDVVPLYLLDGEDTYKDGIDFTVDEFYEKLKVDMLTTSQPNPMDFFEVFEKYGDDEILCVTISDKLSGTYQSAKIAKGMSKNKNIGVLNSETASVGMRQLILKAVDMRDKGFGIKEVAKELVSLKHRLLTIGMADTMENLKRGGRISGVKFVTASILNIKPVLIVKDGLLQAYNKRARGRKNAIKLIVKAILKGNVNKDYPIIIGYTKNDESAQMLREKLLEHDIVAEENFVELGSVIATHTAENAFVINLVLE